LRPPTTNERSQLVGFFSKIRVECYAGYRGDEEPRRFHWRGESFEVTEILDRWLDPNHRYFKVHADDGEAYLLRHDTNTGDWEMSRRVSS
jgi:hypothetical protein